MHSPFDLTVRTIRDKEIPHLPEGRGAPAGLDEAQVLGREPEFGRRIRAGQTSALSQAF
jgi:hypothetical protein